MLLIYLFLKLVSYVTCLTVSALKRFRNLLLRSRQPTPQQFHAVAKITLKCNFSPAEVNESRLYSYLFHPSFKLILIAFMTAKNNAEKPKREKVVSTPFPKFFILCPSELNLSALSCFT